MRAVAGRILAVVATACLFVLSLPPADYAPLGFFCITPLLIAFRAKGFALGFGAGIVSMLLAAWLSCTGWFYQPSLTDAPPDWNYTGFALFGIVIGLTCGICGEVKDPPKWFPWALAAWAVLFEALLLLYIPAHLALTQYRMFPAMKLASIGGIWLVSYVVWVVNLHLAASYVDRRRLTLALCGAFLGAYFGVAAFTGSPRSSEFKVGLIQTDTMDLDELTALNAKATSDGAKVVVWPELTGEAAVKSGDATALINLAISPGQAPFVTSFHDSEDPPHNAASLFSDEGESRRYYKRKLFSAERTTTKAGDFAVAASIDDVTYGINICFDSCFPSIMRETALLDGVEMILLPTLDPVGPYGTVQAFHAAFTTFRAAELGVPIVRADWTAYSMAVDSRGVIVAELGPGENRSLVAELAPNKRETVYKKFGDWFLWLCGAVVLMGIWLGRKESRARKGVT